MTCDGTLEHSTPRHDRSLSNYGLGFNIVEAKLLSGSR
jgi:hypothetical protein